MPRQFCTALICRLVLAVGCVLAASPAALAATSSPPPSLRLFAGDRSQSVPQWELRFGAPALGLWIAAAGGAFQIDVQRPNYGPWAAAQVDAATGAPLRPVPMSTVNPSRGLTRFLSVRYVDARGRVRARQTLTFCPSGGDARVDDTGPVSPSYPGCFGGFGLGGFPFVRGLVWGIGAGWAVSAASGGYGFPPGALVLPPPCLPKRVLRGGLALEPGHYTVIAAITTAYRRLFAIPAAQASATVRLTITPSPTRKGRGPGCGRRVVGLPASDGPAAAAGRLAAATITDPDPATMPNLVALPAWQIRTRRAGHRDLLTFNATIWNAGPAPFTIEGYRRGGSDVMDAYEYFFDSTGNVVGRAPAGSMIYDNRAGHHHWHISQLAAYDLVGPSGVAVRSHKQSFCIAPSNAVDLTVPGAVYNPNAFGGLGFGGSVCDLFDPAAIWLREQLPAGWGDTYLQRVAGQAFDITRVPNGTYRVQVRVNPLGLLTETSTADDLATRVVRLSGRRGARTVSVSPWNGIQG